MKNLEQIRALHVLNAAKTIDAKGKKGGESVAKKIPPHIINHGLMQTLAFAKDQGEGYKNICDCIAQHLSEQGLVDDCKDTESLLRALAEGDSTLLKHATHESMAWLNYARRFI